VTWEKIVAAKDNLASVRGEALAAAYKASLKKKEATVKQLQEGEKAWRKKATNKYADIANITWQACSRMQEKAHENELAAMRKKYGPRMDARAGAEGGVAALLTEARQDLRRETAKVARLEEEREDYGKMERDRDELRAMVDVLEERIGVLIVSEEEGKVWRGKSMQQAQALVARWRRATSSRLCR